MDGYERSRGAKRSRAGEASHLLPEYFALGVITALCHDFSYLNKRSDRRHRYGAEYTMSHVTRGSKNLGAYLPRLGMRRLANTAPTLVHYTGYERPAETIPINDTLLRRVDQIHGTADIIAQMSDRC